MGNAAADLLLSDSTTRMLQNPRIRALDGQKATLKIGERIPTATGTYTSGTTSGSTTSFQYIDVGVNVELTPTIHENRDVSLKLALEVSSQSGTVTISSVDEPIIAQQKVDQVIRLREGEVTILAGLVEKELKGTVSGWPGLGEIFVQHTGSRNDRRRDYFHAGAAYRARAGKRSAWWAVHWNGIGRCDRTADGGSTCPKVGLGL